ncbi:VOC family protein [Pelagibius sp.]|uniref:VOC family protein n=1 Tax=Pelagibius sp. TaxID=1931238 RepID=UPI002610F27F|nr:VOC family protein [Pelagibius sp.]
MRMSSLHPIVTTDHFSETKTFYRALQFTYAFEGEWYVHLVWPANPVLQLAFMRPEQASQHPLFRSRFSGKGLFFGLEVDAVDSVHDDLLRRGFEIEVSLRDEPWGQRHFAIQDPNGIMLDFYTMTEPTADYAEQFRAEGGTPRRRRREPDPLVLAEPALG